MWAVSFSSFFSPFQQSVVMDNDSILRHFNINGGTRLERESQDNGKARSGMRSVGTTAKEGASIRNTGGAFGQRKKLTKVGKVNKKLSFEASFFDVKKYGSNKHSLF